jgi:hypothetical protein
MKYNLTHFVKALKRMRAQPVPVLGTLMFASACVALLIVYLFTNYFWYTTSFVTILGFSWWLAVSLEEVKRKDPL